MNRRGFLAGSLALATLADARANAARAARINVRGRIVATMQQAADLGGEIDVSAGDLGAMGGPPIGAAHVRKPVRVVGHGTRIAGQSIGRKGTFIVDADASFAGLDISGARGDGIGAAFRHQSGNLRVLRTRIHDCENGLLGPALHVDCTLVVDDCDVFGNGTGTGQTHGLYVGEIREFTCTNSRFRDTRIGHHVKSRALRTTISGCEIGTDFEGNESYNVDVPQGGDVTIARCRMRQGTRTDNRTMLNFGGERDPHAGGSLAVADTAFISTYGGTGIRIHGNVDVVATISNCTFEGIDVPVNGRCVMSNCTHNGQKVPDGPYGR